MIQLSKYCPNLLLLELIVFELLANKGLLLQI